MRRLTLFQNYWASLAALVTLPIVAAGVVMGESVYRRSYDAAIDRQLLEARQAAYSIERSVLPAVDRLRLIAALPWNYESATPAEFVSEARRLIRQYPIIQRVQRIDGAGGIIGFFAQDGRERSPGDRERQALARFGEAPESANETLLVPREERAAWSLAMRERGTRNLQIADLRTDVVTDAILGGFEPGANVVFVVDQRGTIVAHRDMSLTQAATTLADLRGWQAIHDLAGILNGPALEGSLGERAVQISRDPKFGDDWFVSYRRIRELGWTVFALAPASNLRAPIRAAVAGTGLVLLAANLVALVLAWILAHRMSKPVASLANASQRIADGDLTAHAEVFAADDIGRLARQFNAMVDELRASYESLEQRVAEKTSELERANRHKSEFLAQMSHELRTPLNAIIGFSDALKAQYFGPLTEKQSEYVRDINTSGHHLLSLINDLLDLAKIEAGRMELAVGRVDVRAIVESSAALIRQRALQKGIALEVRIDPNASTCYGDARRLKQVLVNLLTNAVKYTSSGGRVELRVEHVDSAQGTASGVRFLVIDTGIGIAPEQIPQLFTDFGQLRQPDEALKEGTGLGLALSQRIVALHGGKIEVRSELGKGSTFCFTVSDQP